MCIFSMTCQISLHRISPLVTYGNLQLLLNVATLVYASHYSRIFHLFILRIQKHFPLPLAGSTLDRIPKFCELGHHFQRVFSVTLVLQDIIEANDHINIIYYVYLLPSDNALQNNEETCLTVVNPSVSQTYLGITFKHIDISYNTHLERILTLMFCSKTPQMVPERILILF